GRLAARIQSKRGPSYCNHRNYSCLGSNPYCWSCWTVFRIHRFYVFYQLAEGTLTYKALQQALNECLL
ncbi:hypothetical protein ACVZJ5_004924, partial [Enterobacter hormaechei]